jgi:phage tail-like protein
VSRHDIIFGPCLLYPPKADIDRCDDDVRLLPGRDIDPSARNGNRLARRGAGPHQSPTLGSRTQFQPIVLARGLTHDTEFENWANKVWQLGQETSLADFRKDILIQLINEAGQIVIAYKVHRCWPSEYVALPDLDANATDVAFEQLILQNEGWERDTSVAEPQEPSF